MSSIGLGLLAGLVNLSVAGCGGSGEDKKSAIMPGWTRFWTGYKEDEGVTSAPRIVRLAKKFKLTVPGNYNVVEQSQIVAVQAPPEADAVPRSGLVFDFASPEDALTLKQMLATATQGQAKVALEQPRLCQVAQISFQQVDYTCPNARGELHGFVMLAQDGDNRICIYCGPNPKSVLASYEQIVHSLTKTEPSEARK
jgi:hypothetical protein